MIFTYLCVKVNALSRCFGSIIRMQYGAAVTIMFEEKKRLKFNTKPKITMEFPYEFGSNRYKYVLYKCYVCYKAMMLYAIRYRMCDFIIWA